MMSAIPFRVVEGFIALPSAAPFDGVAASFGREWALRLPTVEINARYAAVTRTFCLSLEAFCAIWCWDYACKDRYKADKVAGPLAGLSSGAGSSPVNLTRCRDEKGSGLPRQSSWLTAAGACAVGAAVLVAWLWMTRYTSELDVVHLVSQPETRNRTSGGAVSASAPAATDETRMGTAERSATIGPESKGSGPAASREATNRAATGPLVLAHLSASVEARTARHSSQEQGTCATDSKCSTGCRRQNRTTAAGGMPAVLPFAAHRPYGAHSLAGWYSPRQPAARSSDEYDSIAMRANVDTAPAGPPATSTLHSDDMDWVAHVTQRRVTEIPDQFSK